MFREHLILKTTSKHKELTPGGKKNHAEHVKNLKLQLSKYGVNPFDSSCRPKILHTGVEIEDL